LSNDSTKEWLKCSESALYFIHTYCQIYDATNRVWVPFHLWPGQVPVVKDLQAQRLLAILKARQMGLTWLILAWFLWLALFRPAATLLIFSKRDDEAEYLLGDERLKGMHKRLPPFLQSRAIVGSNGHEFSLSNGSVFRAFPTTAGDSYTATAALVDEADLVQDLNKLMNAVKPTIDGGGQMILLSRSNKNEPESEFKTLYKAARSGAGGWHSIFLPWHVRPERDAYWYNDQYNEIKARTTSLDDLWQQYPSTDFEALAPRTLDKRLPPLWIARCNFERWPLSPNLASLPAIPGLEVYALPQPDRHYTIGADPAEGNPTSDDSALEILDRDTGEEVAALAQRLEISTFAAYVGLLSDFYNRAKVMVLRNNHGHAVIGGLQDSGYGSRLLNGPDKKPGYVETGKGKALLYTEAADTLRDAAAQLHASETIAQLSNISGSTLRAPEGQKDDRACAWVAANWGRAIVVDESDALIVEGVDPLLELDRGGF
jgi:hypothetical protein